MAQDWRAVTTDLPRGRHQALWRGAAPASRAEVIAAWREDPAFRAWFTARLAEAPFPAFRWETPALTPAAAGLPYEHVLLGDAALDRAPDPAAFAAAFRREPAAEVVTFANLGGDATLVVPTPRGAAPAYVHLAVFLREAPPSQVHALWQAVGAAAAARLGARPFWLSTAGAGVAWLHVRLDDRPKYYGHGPYRAAPAPA